jgi:hypothetical protein
LGADIKKGLSDPELMDRHELSHGQLQKIFAQLVKAGYLGQELLDGRGPQEAKNSCAGASGTNATAVGNESSPSVPLRPVPPERQSLGPSPDLSPNADKPQPSSPSLPLSREEGARFRRNGLILILASLGLVTMRVILAKLQKGAEYGSFPLDDVGVVPRGLAVIGWLVTAILGCLWRVRGLGHHAAWAIVAPFSYVNLVVVEALSNRYEPDSDRRGLRVAFAVLGQFAWLMVWSQIIKFV